DHARFAQKGSFVTGSRVLIREGLTKKMLAEKNCIISIHDKGTKNTINGVHLPWLSPLLQHYRQWDISYSRGCNMAFWKEDLLKVNGYNEAITGWGSEDHELVCRLINNGVRKRTIKFAGIVFHLHHELHGTDNLSNNRSILNETKVRKLTWCDKGIIQN
ncbi:galactosyltransferase-related protein, partial [Bacteroides xylanisolvens]